MKYGLMILMISLAAGGCGNGYDSRTYTQVVAPTHPDLYYLGRVDLRDSSRARFAWTGTGVTFEVSGGSLALELGHSSDRYAAGYYHVEISGRAPVLLRVETLRKVCPVADDLGPGPHRVTVFKRTEAETGEGYLYGIHLTGGELLPRPAPSARRIEFVGNSITCGYGNEGDKASCPFSPETENGWLAYGAITARQLGAEYRAIAWSGRGIWQNYSRTHTGTLPDLYEQTMPHEPVAQFDPAAWVPDVLVINLGTNDFAHGTPDEGAFCQAYTQFLGRLRGYYPHTRLVLLTGSMMRGRPLETLQAYLTRVVATRAAAGDTLISRFDLSPQGELGYGCDWHPNLAQHARNAGELTAFLRQEMGW